MGLIILLIGLNQVVAVVIIIIKAGSWGSRWFAAMDPDSLASEAEKPAERDRRKRRETRKHKTKGEREDRLVIQP